VLAVVASVVAAALACAASAEVRVVPGVAIGGVQLGPT
jgi:pseudouridine-5'-phosphate glycosidase